VFPLHTEYHDLLGVHGMTLAVSLKDYPTFDYFLKVDFQFKLTITSACSDTKFGQIGSQLKAHTITYFTEINGNLAP
jgi:hypothetical protein